MNNWENDLENRPVTTLIRAGVIAIVVIGGFAIVGSLTGIITSPFRSAAGIVERTVNPDNVIANYEWFKRQYQDIKAIDVNLANAEGAQASFEKSAGDRSTWKFDDRQEWARLNSVALGLRNQRAEMVAEYNARTQMANRNLFRTSDLPAEIQ